MFFAVVSTLLLLFVALVTAENVEVLSNGEVKASLLKSAVTTDLLQSFSDAWNAHDLDKVMTFMSEDSEFHAVAGPDLLGKSWVGKDQVTRLLILYIVCSYSSSDRFASASHKPSLFSPMRNG